MFTSPALSVVVPTLAGAVRLPPLLASLETQRIERPWELVVVTDGVVDDTPAILDSWLARLPMRVVRLDGPRGVAAALRAGYEATRGAVVMRCDDDLTLPPGLLAGHLALHDDHPHLGVISLTRDVFPETPYARAYGRSANERAREAALDCPAHARWQHWAACNSVRRDDYDRAGGFDHRFTYREDSELGLRLVRQGVELVIPEHLTVEHRGPATTAEGRLGRAFVSGASLVPFRERHPDVHRPPLPSRSVGSRGWSAATLVVSRMIRTTAGARRAGRVIDRGLRRLPTAIGGRLVALGVESAGRAGEHHGSGVTWQKLEE